MKIQPPNLNHLIKKGIEPKPNQEYILFMGQIHAPVPYVWQDKPYFIPSGTIVKDVKIRTNEDNDYLGYDFTVKETGLVYHTNYPWNLLEYTPENMKKLAEYEKKEAKLRKMEKELKAFRKTLATLEIK
jgi:hypothetical protein